MWTLTTGAFGGVGLAPVPWPPDSAVLMRAAASSAVAASAVPNPDPSFRPPLCRNTVLLVSAFSTCAGVSVGNCDLISAAMPATTALAALVVRSLV